LPPIRSIIPREPLLQESIQYCEAITPMSQPTLRFARLLVIIGVSTGTMGQIPASWALQDNFALDAVESPVNLPLQNNHKTVVVAIVDDGVRITHQDLVDFIWLNPLEQPDNNIDDDGNGYVDDIHGWDVSDSNNTLTPPEDRLEQYSHGTHMAGIVTQIARRAYGDKAVDAIRIMPVKAMSDEADRLYIKKGFEGIRYAIDAGADIIICAWNINQISQDQERILQEAEEKGILIVASAGNIPQELEQYPAAHRSVLAVAALDRSGLKAEKSSYGQFVDIAAPGTDIRSASAISDSAYLTESGTSMAAAITAGGAALVSVEHPAYSPAQISACLKSSVDAYEQIPADQSGKLGAGKLNVTSAINCELLQDPKKSNHILSVTKGFLRLDSTRDKETTWLIEPPGHFKGIRFRPVMATQKSGEGILRFYSELSPSAAPIAEFQLSALPESIYIPGSSAYVVLESEAGDSTAEQLLEYEFETINFSTLYCSGTQRQTVEGTIEDGSNSNDYSPASSCKWLITAPEGQLVHFKFVEFDTEANTDYIYFFDGAGTHEAIMARFSGAGIPPELTTWHNQVLVWFVTDREKQGKGWKAEVRFKMPE